MKILKAAKRVLQVNRTNSSIAIGRQREIENVEGIPYRYIPGPKPLPILGNSWRFIPYIGNYEIEHIDQLSKRLYNQYGSIVKMEGLLGRPDMLFLFDPDDIERVFRQEDLLPFRPSMPSLNYYKHVHRKEFFADNAGVIAVHGENWQHFRTKVNQIMMQPRVAKMYMKPIERAAIEFVERIRAIKDTNDEMPDDFLNEIHKWSLESIARVALDVRLGCLETNSPQDTQKLIDAVNTFFANVGELELKIPFWRLFNTPTFKKYIDALDTIKEISMQHINVALQKRNNIDRTEEPSVLQRILSIDNDTKTACVLALDMFLVGIDTTSNAVASILYQLALNKTKQDYLHEEISEILPHSDTEITNEKLEQMVYLRACIKETMRMFPVVIGNGRCTTKDCIIGGYHIPKGVQVVFQHYVISNLEQYFQRSNEFVPERWLKSCPVHNSDENIFKQHHPFASLPFGYGRRMCLGRRFAELEIQTIIAKVIQKYQIEYHHEKLKYHVHPMYTPDGPLKLRFIEK